MDPQEVFDVLTANIEGTVRWGVEGGVECQDFGRNFTKTPLIIVDAAGESDIAFTLKTAASAGKTVTVRGSALSCNGQTVTDDILLINRLDDDGVRIEMLENNRVSVPTGYTWFTLEKKLNEHGLMVPVLTDNLGTSIGGTLSVGGFGIRSTFYGSQVDLVEKLKLILPSGESVWCSPDENADLFSFSLAGLGALGVIETVILQTVPREEPIVYRRCDYASLDDLDQALGDLQTLIDDPQTQYVRLPGFPTNHGPLPEVPLWIEYGQPATEANQQQENPLLPETENRKFTGPMVLPDFTFFAHSQDEQYVGSFDPFAKCFMDYFFPREDLPQFLPHLKEIMGDDHLQIVYVMSINRPTGSHFVPFHPVKETGRHYLSVGAYYFIPPTERDYIPIARGRLNGLLEKCIELGGRPYLYGTIDLTDDHKRAIYGDDYERLLQLKVEHDPKNVVVSSSLLPGLGEVD